MKINTKINEIQSFSVFKWMDIINSTFYNKTSNKFLCLRKTFDYFKPINLFELL